MRTDKIKYLVLPRRKFSGFSPSAFRDLYKYNCAHVLFIVHKLARVSRLYLLIDNYRNTACLVTVCIYNVSYFTRLLSICDHIFRYDCSAGIGMVCEYARKVSSNFAHTIRDLAQPTRLCEIMLPRACPRKRN